MGGTPLWVSIPFAIFLVAATVLFIVMGLLLWSSRRE